MSIYIRTILPILLMLWIIPAAAQDSLHVRCLWQQQDWHWGFDVQSYGDYIVVGRDTSFRVYDVTAPSSPVEVGWFGLFAYVIAIQGPYAYVPTNGAVLRIVDLSTPSTPVVAGNFSGYCNHPCSSFGVAVSDSYVYMTHMDYVGEYDSGLRVINVSNPSSPSQIGHLAFYGHARAVAVQDAIAYIADDNTGLRIINVSNPSAPVQVGSCPTGDAHGVAVAGQYAFVADGYDGVRVIDVSNPVGPVQIGLCDTPGYAWGITVRGNYAYVADYDSGVRVLDISDPFAPVEVGFYDTPGHAYHAALHECVAYVADYNCFGIYDISYFGACPAAPCSPENVVIQPLPALQVVRLAWPGVTRDVNGAPITVDYYTVYRSVTLDATEYDSIGMVLPADTLYYLDAGNSSKSFYRVKAVKL